MLKLWASGAAALCVAATPPAATFTPLSPATGPHAWTHPPRTDGGPLRFAVIGDRTGVARPGVFAQAMRQIDWLAPDLIISVGDLIEGYEDDPAAVRAEWDAFEPMVSGLRAPFFHTPGNHDLGTVAQEKVWRERLGSPWYGFVYKDALFLVLDTEDPPMPMSPERTASFHALVQLMNRDPAAGDAEVERTYFKMTTPAVETDVHISDAEVAFVRRALAAHPHVRWTFLFFHKPAWKSDSAQWRQVVAALGARPYTVFAGHLHYYSHEVLNGRDYFDMATTGAVAHRPGPGTMDHTLLVTLTDQGPTYANIRLNGLADGDNQTGQVRAH